MKTKLSWGLGFLFLIIFTLVGFCSYYVGKLSQESESILKDNYNQLFMPKICSPVLMT